MNSTFRLLKVFTYLYLVLSVAIIVHAAAQTPEFKEILSLEAPGSTLISPDGRFVLYTVSTPDWEENQYRSQIWMIEVATGEIRQMTYAKQSSGNIRWSPDSKYFSFVAARDEKSQIYIMSPTGGEARPVTNAKTGIRRYEWSPDATRFAYIAPDEPSKQDKAKEKKYGHFEAIEETFNMSRLWLCNVTDGKTEKIVDRDDLNVNDLNWSPGGTLIAITATPDPRTKSFSESDIYVVNPEDKSLSPVVEQPGPDSSPVWSPCGKYLAFSTKMGKDTYFLNSEIAVIPVASGEIRLLTGDFDEDAGLLDWKESGIFFRAYRGMSAHLFRLAPDTGRIDCLTGGNGQMLSGISLTRDAGLMAFSLTGADSYPEIYVSALADFAPRKLTDFTAQISDWTLSVKEPVSWKSTDGTEITGVLIKPADFDPQKKYPLLVIIHGGPTGISYPQKVDRYNRYYPIEQWAAKGALILEPNYRGSAGFGSEFRKLNYRNLGVGDYWDVISGVDHLIGQGFVDPDKVGAMGWSQGGYISAYITTFSDRFAATSVGAGISDWVSYYYRTDITPFTIHYLGANPWDDPEVYRKTSPMTYINLAKTPTLIQHGENDQRVPINNAYKLYRGLQDRNVPVRFVVYKGFGHGITKPRENLAVLTHNWQWFGKYIWGEEPEEEVFEEETAREVEDGNR